MHQNNITIQLTIKHNKNLWLYELQTNDHATIGKNILDPAHRNPKIQPHRIPMPIKTLKIWLIIDHHEPDHYRLKSLNIDHHHVQYHST